MTRLLLFFISFSAIANTKNFIIVGEPKTLSALQFCGIEIGRNSNVHQLKLTQDQLYCLNSMKNDSEIIEDEELELSKQPSFILDRRVNFMAEKASAPINSKIPTLNGTAEMLLPELLMMASHLIKRVFRTTDGKKKANKKIFKLNYELYSTNVQPNYK